MTLSLTTRATDGRRVIPYAAGHSFFFTNVATVGNPAKDLVVIRGSATREVILLGWKIVLNVPGDATTLAYMFMQRRTGLGSGGVATSNFAAVNLDASTEAATATVFGWTTSPTTQGTLVGVLDMEPTASLAGASPQDPHDCKSVLSVPSGGIRLTGVDDTVTVGYSGPGRSVAALGVSVFAVAHWLEVLPRSED